LSIRPKPDRDGSFPLASPRQFGSVVPEPERAASNARRRYREDGAMADDDEGGSGWGILIFIAIFGVGNLILYLTTGMFLIPLK
jgi:hypothetical protein